MDFEKLGDFIQRISSEYPQAEILTKPPEPEMLQSNKQYIQIVTVKPIAELPNELEVKQEINDKVCAYYLTNKVDTFLYDRPLMKDVIDKDNEFKNLWSERTILKIERKLPSILRWFEVIDRKSYQLTPVENACDIIENMNKELKKLIISYNYDSTKQLTPLTMRLQGTIDASVNGGLRMYTEAFFNPDYIETHVNYYQHIKRLKKLIFNQINLLDTGLILHERSVPGSLLPLHEMLVEKFSLMKNSFIRDSSYIVDMNDKKPSILSTPLPPIPPAQQQQHKQVTQLRNGNNKDSIMINNGSSEDDLYSVLEADSKLLARHSLGSPLSYSSSISSLNSSKHKSMNGLSQTAFNTSIPYNNSTSSLTNGNNNRLVYHVALSNGNQSLLNQQRSNSIPRNNMQQFNQSPEQNSILNYLPLPPRSERTSQIISPSKLSLESGIETDLSSDSNSKPILPRRANKKTILTSAAASLDQQPSMLISVDYDKNSSILNTVISSNATYIENLKELNGQHQIQNNTISMLTDLPPPLPCKKNRLPSSRSTTIINIQGNNDLDSNGLLNGGTNLINHFENNLNNLNNLNNSIKSTSSMSTSSSSTNEYTSFTETTGNTTTTTFSSNNSSFQTESSHQNLQNLSLNDIKDH